nr:energy transducer TonB [Chitinophagaceae bacterium]
TWIVKRENGTKKMQLEYEADSLIQTFCFEEDGKPQARGECVFEKHPSFPGGVKGWTNFLQRTLHYPDEALNRDIQGVVKVEFTVNKDGSLTDFVILNSPDLSLSREVIRIMSKSPSWEPAIR